MKEPALVNGRLTWLVGDQVMLRPFKGAVMIAQGEDLVMVTAEEIPVLITTLERLLGILQQRTETP